VTYYDRAEHSKWIPLMKSIQTGSKKDHQLLIKDLLEGLDTIENH